MKDIVAKMQGGRVRPNNEEFEEMNALRKKALMDSKFWNSDGFTLDQVSGRLNISATKARTFMEKGVKDGWVKRVNHDLTTVRRYRKPDPRLLRVLWTRKELQKVLTPASTSGTMSTDSNNQQTGAPDERIHQDQCSDRGPFQERDPEVSNQYF